jgi:hypothetical protein
MAMEIERESVDDKAASRERQKKKRSSKDREVEAAERIARRLGPPPGERATPKSKPTPKKKNLPSVKRRQ